MHTTELVKFVRCSLLSFKTPCLACTLMCISLNKRHSRLEHGACLRTQIAGRPPCMHPPLHGMVPSDHMHPPQAGVYDAMHTY